MLDMVILFPFALFDLRAPYPTQACIANEPSAKSAHQ
jgi:hypothetical protein